MKRNKRGACYSIELLIILAALISLQGCAKRIKVADQSSPNNLLKDPVSCLDSPFFSPRTSQTITELEKLEKSGANSRVKKAFEFISKAPQAIWLVEPSTTAYVAQHIADAKSAKKIPIFITYNLPDRDCHSYSSGGSSNSQMFSKWLDQIEAGFSDANEEIYLIIEPDAVGHIFTCDKLYSGENLKQKDRAKHNTKQREMIIQHIENLKTAVNKLGGKKRIQFLDVGHWVLYQGFDGGVNQDQIRAILSERSSIDSNSMNGPKLTAALIEIIDPDKHLRGISLNVSNYHATLEMVKLCKNLDKASNRDIKCVVDTSRNGKGSLDNRWCNPPGRALGAITNYVDDMSPVIATMWLKSPTESDGKDNSNPEKCGNSPVGAGQVWPERALSLYENSRYFNSCKND